MAATSPADFVDGVLAPLEPLAVAVGADFTFGARGAGTTATLADLSAGRFEVLTSPIVAVDGRAVSSSAIRRLLLDGRAGPAAHLLGRDFAVRGEVVHGDQRGRQLGFPTANLLPDRSLVTPADGVYAGWLRRLDVPGSGAWPAAVSVGDNPTFGSSRRVEAYVLPPAGDGIDLYGAEVEIGFHQWLRGMVVFEGVAELIAQMTRDVAEVSQIMRLA